jgi:twitching motility protein PilT
MGLFSRSSGTESRKVEGNQTQGQLPAPPTQPGGKLPAPDWHREFETVVPSAATSPRQRSGSDAATLPVQGTPIAEQAGGSRPIGSIKSLLREAVDRGASDLHLSTGVPPIIRLDGRLIPLDYEVLTPETSQRLVTSMMTDMQRARFEEDWELDVSIEYPEIGRFRVNLHRQRGAMEAAVRVVNDVILPLRKLGIPPVVEEIARKQSGLVLVTGPTGSGKTTTLASIVDMINCERQCMIVTIEDPIEYIHQNKRSVIKQREVTSDTRSFAQALRHVLRQDPDVIVIGEMRDLETISTALVAAETGHMVFATLHTPDASQTIDRMIDVFPPHQQEQARIQVANTLQAVVSQQLLPVPGDRGRVVAVEILIATPAVRKIIRSQKTEQLFTTMQTGWEIGMITMDKSLKMLYQQGLVSREDAVARCRYPLEFDVI